MKWLLLLANLTSVTVIDGDTIDYYGERIRILNIDTAEIKAQCEDELLLAIRAKRRLAELLRADFIVERIARRDRYGRTLATISVNGTDVGEILITEGLARRWDGRRHPWCGQ